MQENWQQLRDWIQESDNIVFFGGAGVSTESGIPDFRGEKGIYATMSEYGYRPETILSHSFFESHPEIFFQYYKKYLLFPNAKPNACHFALAQLEKMGKLKAVVTQNIDNLHQLAGSKHVLELHGTLYRNYCVHCKKEFSLEYVMTQEGITHCDRCGAMVRPDVVLYEEGLNEETLEEALRCISEAEMLIIGGTSLNVYPAAGLVRYYRGKKLVLINKSETPYDYHADLIIRDPIGQVFSGVMVEI